MDAQWTKENGETFYGYKNHAKVDTRAKMSSLYRDFTHLYTSVNTRKTRLDSLCIKSWEQVKLCFDTHKPTRFAFGYSSFR